jgi:hypothetical protein
VVGGTTWQRSRTPYKVAHKVCLCFGSLCLDFVSLASRHLLPDVQVICVALLSLATNSRVLCTVYSVLLCKDHCIVCLQCLYRASSHNNLGWAGSG